MLVLCAFFGVYGQSTPMDVVLILDTSSGMSSSYENVNNYITGSFLSEFLRVGDTFHLITYSGSPKLDIARRITSLGDVETIIGRMLIQYPVESGNNIGSAISFAEQYIASLPSRPKKIVLVGVGGTDANSLVSAARQRLSSRNITFDFVQVTPEQPLANLPSSSRPGGSGTVSSVRNVTTPSTPAPAVTTPATNAAQSGTNTTTQSAAGTTAQPGTSTTTQPAAGTTAQSGTGTDAGTAAQPGTAGSSGAETGAAVSPAEETPPAVSGTAGTGIAAGEPDTPAAPGETRESVRETGTASSLPSGEQRGGAGTAWASSMPFIIGLVILALIILGIIIFFATRRLGSGPNRVVAQAAAPKPEPREEMTPFVDHSKDLAKYAAVQNRQRSTPYADRPIKTESAKQAVINPSGPLLLNLFVEDQNTAIGKRNIHSLKSGYSLSVGGGQSDFLIFLVPMPANIGEIRRNGSQCSFIPRKPKYFPDLGSNELRDCINKTIRVVSDKNYELRFRFEMYEDPLVALNRVLMSVSVPG